MYALTFDAIRVARDEGVTAMAAMLVLLALAKEAEPLTMTEAAGYAGVTTASMTGTVDGLVTLDLVRRYAAEGDRRKVMLGLTAKGWKLADQWVVEAMNLEGVA